MLDPRNKTDEEIRTLAEKGGLVGVTPLAGLLLGENWLRVPADVW